MSSSIRKLKLRKGSRFPLLGKKYVVRRGGIRAIELAMDLAAALEHNRSLLPYRTSIRRIRPDDCRAILTYLIDRPQNDTQRRVALFLRGRCGGYLGKDIVAKFAKNANEPTRRTATRALRRMSAWNVLRQIQETDPSPSIRKIAAPQRPRGFRDRFRDFSRSVRTRPTKLSARPLFINPTCELSARSAKSAALIRRILMRIHAVLRQSADSRERLSNDLK